jgi:hypothetical protein
LELVEDKGEEEVTWFEFGFDEERLSTPNGWKSFGRLWPTQKDIVDAKPIAKAINKLHDWCGSMSFTFKESLDRTNPHKIA